MILKCVRVDLRGVTVCDVDALMMLEVLLFEWSSESRRQGQFKFLSLTNGL